MPRGDPYRQIAVRLPDPLYQQIRHHAASAGQPAAAWIRARLEEADDIWTRYDGPRRKDREAGE